MYVQTLLRAAPARLAIVRTALTLAFTLIIFIGPIAACGNQVDLFSNDGSRPTLGLDIEPDAPTHVETGNNEALEIAQRIELGDQQELIQGRISGAGDVDVYDLGPVSPGDRVRVELQADAGLNGAIGLFDDTGCTLLINDHRNIYLGRQGPFVDVTIRRSSDTCLVALAPTPGFESTGSYELSAVIEFPAPIPTPRRDVFILDFEGGSNVRIGTRPAVSIPRFAAENISRKYSGLTTQMIEQIAAKVRRQFAGYNITIHSSSETTADDDSTSRIYFGTYDPALLGVAEGVDEYNAVLSQHAIVFTDTFEVFEPLRPSLEAMSQAIANVASHEIGHLLGLVHTDDETDIMDVTASLRQLLAEQLFGRAPIYSLVFPLGDQDSAQMLLDAVGADPAAPRIAPTLALEQDNSLSGWKRSEPPARGLRMLGGCGLHKR